MRRTGAYTLNFCAAGMLAASAFLLSGVAYADALKDFSAVSTPERTREALDTFESYLKRLDPKLKLATCDTLIYNHLGSVETIYGGVCRLSTGVDVTVCGDTGVGEFALSWSADNSKEVIARFARTNCPGG